MSDFNEQRIVTARKVHNCEFCKNKFSQEKDIAMKVEHLRVTFIHVNSALNVLICLIRFAKRMDTGNLVGTG